MRDATFCARAARSCGTAIVLLFGAIAVSHADDVYLANGSVFEQVEAHTTETHVIIEMAVGKLTVPRAQVLRVVEVASPLSEFRRRQSELLADPTAEAESWLELARWGLVEGLTIDGTNAALLAARLDPDLVGVGTLLPALGYERVDGVGWLVRAKAMQLRGLVPWGDEWVTPNERLERQAARAAEGRQGVPRATDEIDDNEVALASLRLAERALDTARTDDQRELATEPGRHRFERYGPQFGAHPFGPYQGVIIPTRQFHDPEAAERYREQVRRDWDAVASRQPGSIISAQSEPTTPP